MEYDIIEGFDQYSTTEAGTEGSLQNQYAGGGFGLSLNPGLSGRGQSVGMRNGAGAGMLLFPVAVPSQLTTVAFAFQLIDNAAGVVSGLPFSFRGPLNQAQFSLAFDSANKMKLVNGAGVQLALSEKTFIIGQVYRICCAINMSGVDNLGSLIVSVNGEVDAGLSQEGLVLQSQAMPTIGYFRLASASSGTVIAETHSVDDVIIASGVAEDWGPMEVWTGFPTADIQAQWNPLTGTDNFDMVNEPAFDVDATYNSTDVVGNQDVFEFQNLPVTPEEIKAVAIAVFAKKEESADKVFQPILRLGGIDYNGADVHCNESYTNHSHIHAINPATGVAFTAADLNAIQAGYEFRS